MTTYVDRTVDLASLAVDGAISDAHFERCVLTFDGEIHYRSPVLIRTGLETSWIERGDLPVVIMDDCRFEDCTIRSSAKVTADVQIKVG